MTIIKSDVKLDFKDVLICPKRSYTASRSGVNLFKHYKFLCSRAEMKRIPIIAANMSVTGTIAMAHEHAKHGMMTCLHKHYPVDTLVDFFQTCFKQDAFYTLGITDDDFEKLDAVTKRLPQNSLQYVCVDVANGYTEYFQNKVKQLRELLPSATIMAGNVATPEMVQELIISGAADIVKIGIGPGSVCTTRVMTGVGYPQLSSIIECSDAAHGLRGYVCADGGCTCPGDVAKAFGANADFVMLGGMLAGHDECEGEWKEEAEVKWPSGERSRQGSFLHTCPAGIVTGKTVKKSLKFYGMSSYDAQEKYGGVKDYSASEGKCVEIPYKGPVSDTVKEILGGLRSACAYVGASNLKELPKCTTFVRTTVQENRVYS